ncbi:hypothetical protein Sjap_016368 [Stephania japonica]|uniref:Uncharacterized protein n=1 Tax=Stephania japonica TaxID=461633 RepID=A0AAP0IMI2_9MAGN
MDEFPNCDTTGVQSETEHVPPEPASMLALTLMMYAIVRKVAVPARTSLVKQVFLASNLKYLPILLLETALFRPFCILLHEFPILAQHPPSTHSSPPIFSASSLSSTTTTITHTYRGTINIYHIETDIETWKI